MLNLNHSTDACPDTSDNRSDLPADQDDIHAEDSDRRFIAALAKGLEILHVFKPGEQYLGNTELAKRTGLPKPTVSRLTYTLTKLGYLSYFEGSGKYSLGVGVMSLGYSLLSNLDFRQIARPWMKELAEHFQGVVSLGIRDRMSMIYVETCRGNTPLAIRLDVGTRVPISTTAMGRAFLCGLSEQDRNFFLSYIEAENEVSWPQIKQGIDEALRSYTEKGFCVSYDEWRNDICAVGVPFINNRDNKILAFSCCGPSFILTRDKLENDIGPRLVELVRNVEMALKHS